LSPSQLAQLAFSNELNRRLMASGDTMVLSNAIHPGIVATELVTGNAQANFGWLLGGVIAAVMGLRNKIMAYGVTDGALTQLFAASSPSLTTGGGYYVPIAQPWRVSHPLGEDEPFGCALWSFSEEMLSRPNADGGACDTSAATESVVSQ
jgi:hypothetical protein